MRPSLNRRNWLTASSSYTAAAGHAEDCSSLSSLAAATTTESEMYDTEGYGTPER